MAGKVTIGGSDVQGGLEVRVAGTDETYRVPLLGQLTMGDLMTFRRISKMPADQQSDAYMEAFYELCVRYVPREAIDALPISEFARFVEAWKAASDEGGVTSGE